MARAQDRAIDRALQRREAELTGWVAVGRRAEAVAIGGASPSPPLGGAAESDAPCEELSRAQKRMQKRKEKSRSKRAEQPA